MDFTTIPSWILFGSFVLLIISFVVFLYLGLSGKRDVKLWLFEIKNARVAISANGSEEMNKFNGSWTITAEDIEIPSHPFVVKYCYESEVRLEVKKFEVEMVGHLTFRHHSSNEKIYDTKIEGYGYIADGQGSICYETFAELHKQRATTGLGVFYVKFNLSGNEARGYFLTSNQSEFGLGMGTIEMKRQG